jgi:site-specific DNA-methyltransferase (cytosine-N4-specific)
MRVNFFVMFPVASHARRAGAPTSAPSARRPPGFDNALVRAFPNITNVDVSATIAQVQRVLDQVIRAVEFLFGFTLAGRLVVLFAAVTATREARAREFAVMRAVGAGASLLRQVQRAELLGVGALAGLLASGWPRWWWAGRWRATPSSSAGPHALGAAGRRAGRRAAGAGGRLVGPARRAAPPGAGDAAACVAIFAEVKRVLTDDGTLWLNIGDGYTSGNRGYRAPDKKNPARAMDIRPETPDGLKPKDLIGIPWRLAFALQDDGWYLRSDVVWHKPNAMPESVKDRPARAHEFLFMLTKSERYFYDWRAAREPADGGGLRNRRSVWHVNTKPFAGAHFATFPPELIRPCIQVSTEPGDYVLDPFFGSGTVGLVCQAENRQYVGIELNPEYVSLAADRLQGLDSNVIRIAAA